MLVFVVIVTSAYLRLAQAGLGCADWPACYGASQLGQVGQTPLLIAIMRVAHRIAASAVAFAVIVIAVVSFGALRHERRRSGLAALLVALTVFLAVLGVITPGAQFPAVVLGNLLGGMVLLAVMAWLLLDASSTRPASGVVSPVLAAGAVILALQIALGAAVSANFAGASCPSLPGCSSGWEIAAKTMALLDPWRVPSALQGAALVDDAARGGLHMLHRLGAAVVTIYWCGVALLVIRRGITVARNVYWVAAVLVAQAAIGAAAVASNLPLWLAVLHNAVAAVAVLAATTALFHSRFSVEASVSAACQIEISK